MNNYERKYTFMRLLVEETQLDIKLLELTDAPAEYIEGETLFLKARIRLLEDIIADLADYDDLCN